MKIEAELIVFGDHDLEKKNLFIGRERWTPEIADRIISETNVEKVPVYVGFPTMAGFKKKYTNITPVGKLLKLVKTERGINAEIVFTEDGLTEIRNGRKYIADGGSFKKSKDGYFEMLKLKVIGLTDNHCLPVTPIQLP